MSTADHMHVLHWLPIEDRWETISWDAWGAFRGILAPAVGLSGISGGVHYFIVCVHDDGVPVNLIPHKYMIDPDGRIGADNFAGLTKAERDDYNRIMLAREYAPGEEDRLNAIRQKMGHVYYPPRGSHSALLRALPKRPRLDSAARRVIRSMQAASPA